MNKSESNKFELTIEGYDAGIVDGMLIMKKQVLKEINKMICYYQLVNNEPLLNKKYLKQIIKNL